MKKRRVLLGFAAVFAAAVALLAALLEPTHTVRGLLAGEPFYRGRSTSYWREVLRECGRNGHIPTATVSQFWAGQEAFPVLRECAQDPDRNVHWPAIALLERGNLRTEQVLQEFVRALDDADIEVRLRAVAALAGWGPWLERPSRP